MTKQKRKFLIFANIIYYHRIWWWRKQLSRGCKRVFKSRQNSLNFDNSARFSSIFQDDSKLKYNKIDKLWGNFFVFEFSRNHRDGESSLGDFLHRKTLFSSLQTMPLNSMSVLVRHERSRKFSQKYVPNFPTFHRLLFVLVCSTFCHIILIKIIGKLSRRKFSNFQTFWFYFRLGKVSAMQLIGLTMGFSSLFFTFE